MASTTPTNDDNVTHEHRTPPIFKFDSDGDVMLEFNLSKSYEPAILTSSRGGEINIHKFLSIINIKKIDVLERTFVVRALVSAKHLTLASGVFKAMLCGNFRESTIVSGSGASRPGNIPLPEDDGLSLLFTFAMLHNYLSGLPRTLRIDKLVEFALLIDKYAMGNSVHYFPSVWFDNIWKQKKDKLNSAVLVDHFENFNPSRFNSDVLLIVQLIWMSHLFQKPNAFQKMTELALHTFRGKDFDQLGEFPIPHPILVEITKRRQKIFGDMGSFLNSLKNELFGNEAGCCLINTCSGNPSSSYDCVAIELGYVMQFIRKWGFSFEDGTQVDKTKFDDWTVTELKRLIQNMRQPAYPGYHECCSRKPAIVNEFKRIESELRGLELKEYRTSDQMEVD